MAVAGAQQVGRAGRWSRAARGGLRIVRGRGADPERLRPRERQAVEKNAATEGENVGHKIKVS